MESPNPPDRQPGPPPLQRRVLWGLLVAMLLAVAVAALMAPSWLRQNNSAGQALPVLAEVPSFELINRDGRTVSKEDLLGRPWIADFIFTSCQVSCPAMTQRMAALRPRLPATVSLVSISVDPENDRPEVLEEYARSYQAPDRWYFLTGDRDEIYELIQGGFKLGVQVAPPEIAAQSLEPITHSTRFVLVDAKGKIRGYYDAFDSGAMTRLVQDLGKLR